MKNFSFKDFGSYSLLLIIACNILLYSAALDTANGDYYIAFEIMRSMTLQSWLSGNIATLSLAAIATLLPLTYIILHTKIKNRKDPKEIHSDKYIIKLFIFTSLLLLIFSLFLEYILGFHGILGVALTISFISVTVPTALHEFSKHNNHVDRIIKFSTYSIAATLFITCIALLKNSAIVGESCLLKVSNGVTIKVATVVPIDYSKDSLKAIYLEHHIDSEKNEQAAFIAVRPVDETYSIYPRACSSISLNK